MVSTFICTECDSTHPTLRQASACHRGIGGVIEATDEIVRLRGELAKVTEVEPATEYDADGFPHECDPDGMEFDVTTCQMPGGCAGVKPAPLGFHMLCDPYSDREGAVWHYTFRLPTGELVCEDCAMEWESTCTPA